MHQNSYKKMAAFKEGFLRDRLGHPLKILDVGSQDINGSYKSFFAEPGWTYHGADIVDGPNVDIVLKMPYSWTEIKSGSYDVVISGQTFEHTEYFWLTMLELARALKNNGLCCLIAPSSGPEHRYPVDCYRFYPDGMAALAKFAGLHTLQAETDWEAQPDDSQSEVWRDSLLIARKAPENFWQHFRRYLQHKALQLSLKDTRPDVSNPNIGHMPSSAHALFYRPAANKYSLIIEELQLKAEEVNRLITICAEREALINQLSAVCAERETLINQLSAICAEREVLINQLSAICAEREALIQSLSAQLVRQGKQNDSNLPG